MLLPKTMKILRYFFRVAMLLALIVSISFDSYMSSDVYKITYYILIVSTIGFAFFEIFFFVKKRFNRKK